MTIYESCAVIFTACFAIWTWKFWNYGLLTLNYTINKYEYEKNVEQEVDDDQ